MNVFEMTNMFNYLVGEMLETDKEYTLEIVAVEKAIIDVMQPDGKTMKKEPRPVVKLAKTKRPMILKSRTMIRQMVKACGGAQETGDWVGMKVCIEREDRNIFGESHSLIKIKHGKTNQSNKDLLKKRESKKGGGPKSNPNPSKEKETLVSQIEMVGESKFGDAWSDVVENTLVNYGATSFELLKEESLVEILDSIKSAEPTQPPLVEDKQGAFG